ncbi:MAG: DUF4279 domain-containing protein [Crocosphaera sp.]|nr:DUF4279 domain-containing protein [Crocosphaera sp.]
MPLEILASLTITEFNCDPQNITNKLKIIPTKTWKIGDRINPKTTLTRKHNGWVLDSKLSKDNDLESHFKSLFYQLQPVWESLQEIAYHYDIEISCVIYTDGEIPTIHLDKEIINKSHQINAEIDIDLYVLPKNTLCRTIESEQTPQKINL